MTQNLGILDLILLSLKKLYQGTLWETHEYQEDH